MCYIIYICIWYRIYVMGYTGIYRHRHMHICAAASPPPPLLPGGGGGRRRRGRRAERKNCLCARAPCASYMQHRPRPPPSPRFLRLPLARHKATRWAPTGSISVSCSVAFVVYWSRPWAPRLNAARPPSQQPLRCWCCPPVRRPGVGPDEL
jgi:hypothetical protein